MVFKLLAYFALIMITMKSLLAFLSVFKPFVRAPFAKLVKLICCNSLPMSMVDFSEFHEFVQELDPLYRIPCRKEFGAAAEKMFKL